MPANPTTPARFFTKTTKSGDCWLWSGAIGTSGYGKVSVNNRTHHAHRVAYEFTHGPIPEGMCVCHRCDHRTCVNPSHLFLGTQADNIADMYAKGRGILGEKNHATHLTADDVLAIRARHDAGESSRSLGRCYGVAKSTVLRIVHRAIWTHI